MKQERRKLAEAGVAFRRLTGREITRADWAFFYAATKRTYREHHSTPYLIARRSSRGSAATMPDNLLLVIGERDGQPLCAALDVFDADDALGPLLGHDRVRPGPAFRGLLLPGDRVLHRARIARFEGGAQGVHKLARGLLPVTTYSAHAIADPDFAARDRAISARASASRSRTRSTSSRRRARSGTSVRRARVLDSIPPRRRAARAPSDAAMSDPVLLARDGAGRDADAQSPRGAQHARLRDDRGAGRARRRRSPRTTRCVSSSCAAPASTSWRAATSARSPASCGTPPAERQAGFQRAWSSAARRDREPAPDAASGRRRRPRRRRRVRVVADERLRPRGRRRRRVFHVGVPPHRAHAGRRRLVVAAADRRDAQGHGDHAAWPSASTRPRRCALGLVNKVVRAGRARRATSTPSSRALAAGPVLAVRNAKRLVRESLARTLSEQLAGGSEELRRNARRPPTSSKGITAFVEKRPPQFGRELSRDMAGARRQDAVHLRRLARHRPRDRASRRARRRQRRDRGEDDASRIRSCPVRSTRRPPRSSARAARRCRSSATSATRPRCRRRSPRRSTAFGGIDILVNNASAISLTGTLGDADEALRPHVRRQRARHVPVLAGVPAAPRGVGGRRAQSAHPDAVAAAQPRREMVRADTSPTRWPSTG